MHTQTSCAKRPKRCHPLQFSVLSHCTALLTAACVAAPAGALQEDYPVAHAYALHPQPYLQDSHLQMLQVVVHLTLRQPLRADRNV